MTDSRKVILGVALWVGAVSALHLRLNFDWSVYLNDRLPESQRKLNVAFIPVT